MTGQDLIAQAEPSKLLGRHRPRILATLVVGTDRAAIEVRAEEHFRRQLRLEKDDVLLGSGSLPAARTASASDATAIRADEENAARLIAARDPSALAGLQAIPVRRWRLDEGSKGVRISLGTTAYVWRLPDRRPRETVMDRAGMIPATPVFASGHVVFDRAPAGHCGDLGIACIHDQVSGASAPSPGEAS